MNALSNARHTGESHDQYRGRRTAINAAIKLREQGFFTHRSTEIAVVPVTAMDDKVQEDIRRGLIRDLEPATLKDGTAVMIGRTKGVTHHRTEHRRHEARAIVKAFPRIAA